MVDDILNQMSLEEQVALLSGADFWTTVPNERLAIPSVKMTDGPNGARGAGGLTNGVPAACFPAGVALGATWSVEVARSFGEALAEEAKSKGSSIVLAPTINLHRSGLNGRNFECFSEDPCLTSEIAVAYVEGLQSRGVGATAKHFAANDSEVERQTMSSDVDERTLRELYLAPFEAVVRRGKIAAIMSGYNRLNGTWCAENAWLLGDVLRGDFGYEGIVMSDWFGTRSCDPTINAGVDLEMPGPARTRGKTLLAAVKEGRVPAEKVRESARRMLSLLDKLGAFEKTPDHSERAQDRPEHRALIRRLGAEGAVLLKNDGILPLSADALKTLAAIGPNAAVGRIMGGGSAYMNAHYSISPLEGLQSALPGITVVHAVGASNNRLLRVVEGPVRIEYFQGTALDGAPVLTEDAASSDLLWFDLPDVRLDYDNFSARLTVSFQPDDDGEHLVGLTSAGLSRLLIDDVEIIDAHDGWEQGENFFGLGNSELRAHHTFVKGRTYKVVVEYRTPKRSFEGIDSRGVRFGIERPLGATEIESAVEAAREADVVVLFVGRNHEWDTEGLDLPNMRLPGQQDALIASVAAANPRTVVVVQSGGPVEMPWLDEVAAVLQMWYPGQEAGNAITDVLFGKQEPGGRLPQTFPQSTNDMPIFAKGDQSYPGQRGHVRYAEGLSVGYRHFDRSPKPPLFPFGYGLSYTSFQWTEPRPSQRCIAKEPISVEVDVTNIGARSGSEVVQLYVAAQDAGVERPSKELRAFAKVSLAPGETKTCHLQISPRDLAWFDVVGRAFRARKGRYDIVLASDAMTDRFRFEIELTTDWKEEVSSPPAPLV